MYKERRQEGSEELKKVVESVHRNSGGLKKLLGLEAPGVNCKGGLLEHEMLQIEVVEFAVVIKRTGVWNKTME